MAYVNNLPSSSSSSGGNNNLPTNYVASFNGRINVVVPANNDYNAQQITFTPGNSGIVGNNVHLALLDLMSKIPTSNNNQAITPPSVYTIGIDLGGYQGIKPTPFTTGLALNYINQNIQSYNIPFSYWQNCLFVINLYYNNGNNYVVSAGSVQSFYISGPPQQSNNVITNVANISPCSDCYCFYPGLNSTETIYETYAGTLPVKQSIIDHEAFKIAATSSINQIVDLLTKTRETNSLALFTTNSYGGILTSRYASLPNNSYASYSWTCFNKVVNLNVNFKLFSDGASIYSLLNDNDYIVLNNSGKTLPIPKNPINQQNTFLCGFTEGEINGMLGSHLHPLYITISNGIYFKLANDLDYIKGNQLKNNACCIYGSFNISFEIN